MKQLSISMRMKKGKTSKTAVMIAVMNSTKTVAVRATIISATRNTKDLCQDL